MDSLPALFRDASQVLREKSNLKGELIIFFMIIFLFDKYLVCCQFRLWLFGG